MIRAAHTDWRDLKLWAQRLQPKKISPDLRDIRSRNPPASLTTPRSSHSGTWSPAPPQGHKTCRSAVRGRI
jgi:hypothetical protein